MVLKITSDRKVTLPSEVLDAMGVKPGDKIEITEGPDGFILKSRRIDYSRLAPLRDKIPPGHPEFDIESFRDQPYDPSLRD